MELILLCVMTIAVFTVPGTCIVIALKLDQFRYFFAVGLSLSLFAICLAVSGNLNLEWKQFTLFYLTVVVLLLLTAGYYLYKNGRLAFFTQEFERRDLAVICGILLSYGAYILAVGPYDEVPADFYRHLERVQLMHSDLGHTRSHLAVLHSGLNGRYWYYLYAITWYLSGVSLDQSIYFYSWFNGVLLLSALYLFSKTWLSRRFQQARLLALLTCLFFVLHQGIVSFSFIRYYALSATMICTPIYFLTVLIFTRHIETGLPGRQILAALFCLSTPLLYHYQEALFTLVMIWLLGMYYTVSWYGLRYNVRGSSVNLPEQVLLYWRGIKNRHQGLIAFVLLTISFLAFHIYAYGTITRTDVDHDKVISLQHLIPFLTNLYILNPSYQFYQTIALWGVVVYVGFLLSFRKFLLDPYLLMGMLSPLFTIFNPVFVDFFLRIRDVHVLYRLGYMIPLAMTGACLVWFLLSAWQEQQLKTRCLTTVALAALIVSLFNFDARFVHSEYSRIPTLLEVNATQSAQHWHDLLTFLNSIEEPKQIYTDPVTGYVITAFTHHRSDRYKFTETFHKPINFDGYDNFPLKRYRGGLLVVNLRDGSYSQTGELSLHWPADILQLRHFYSEALLDHIRKNPADFPKLWSASDINVYQIYP